MALLLVQGDPPDWQVALALPFFALAVAVSIRSLWDVPFRNRWLSTVAHIRDAKLTLLTPVLLIIVCLGAIYVLAGNLIIGQDPPHSGTVASIVGVSFFTLFAMPLVDNQRARRRFGK